MTPPGLSSSLPGKDRAAVPPTPSGRDFHNKRSARNVHDEKRPLHHRSTATAGNHPRAGQLQGLQGPARIPANPAAPAHSAQRRQATAFQGASHLGPHQTTHGGVLLAHTARTGERTGRRVAALPYQAVSSGFLPVSPRVWNPSLRGATSPAASVAGLSQPLSARCCQARKRPSYMDGACYPEGCTPDSIAPSAAGIAARKGDFPAITCERQGDRRQRTGKGPGRPRGPLTCSALDLHRRAA